MCVHVRLGVNERLLCANMNCVCAYVCAKCRALLIKENLEIHTINLFKMFEFLHSLRGCSADLRPPAAPRAQAACSRTLSARRREGCPLRFSSDQTGKDGKDRMKNERKCCILLLHIPSLYSNG